MTNTDSSLRFVPLTRDMLTPELGADFDRYQQVTRCWRKENGQWVVKDVAYTEQWGEKEKLAISGDMIKTLDGGGDAVGCFDAQNKLVGFASLENERMGERGEYLELSGLHVTSGMRGRGIGTRMFRMMCDIARKKGAEKLYISAHSSVESQAFYHAVGCREASWYSAPHAEKEPCDCQMEFVL